MKAPDVSAEVKKANTSRCPNCGADLRCGMVSGDTECWCFSMPHVVPVPTPDNGSNKSCLCPACLQELIDRQ